MKFILATLFAFLLFFSFQKYTFAYIPPDTCGCNPSTDKGGIFCCYSQDCAGNSTWTNEPMSTCEAQAATIGNPPPNTCNQSTYQFTYYVCQTQMSQASKFASCDYQYQFENYTCSAVDRCYDPSVGNVTGQTGAGGASGFNTNGQILPGQCNVNAVTYDSQGNVIPNSACVAGGWYKTCCSSGGGYPVTSCSSGSCPNGQITLANVTTCTSSTPPPTSTTTNYYKCVNGACVQDNTSGSFPNDSNCGGTCNASCPTFAPPPPAQPVSCPANTTCIAKGSSSKSGTSCVPNSSCSPPVNCSLTCRDSVGNTCPTKTCQTVWACDAAGSGYVNDGTYYYTCPASCPNCPVGSTQTVCGTTQNTCHVPGT